MPDRSGDKASAGPTCRQSFGQLYERWVPVVRVAAQRLLSRRADAEDVAQDVFTRLWDNGRWQSIDTPRAYLERAARNAALERLRRDRQVVVLPEGDLEDLEASDPTPEQLMARQDRRRALRRMLSHLPSQCSRVMVFVYVMGVPRREVAKRLGITKKAVDKQVARGKRILRRQMDSVEMQLWVSSFEDGGGGEVVIASTT